MSQIQELSDRLQRELYAKNLPGSVILNLREKWLEKFLLRYSPNIEALMLGFMLSDFKMQEANDLRKPHEHIRMAYDYAKQAFERYTEIPIEVQQISLEVISAHHGATTSCLESKLFKNACGLACLEPKGWMFLFRSFYEDKSEDSFAFALKKIDEKISESMLLVDIDSETIAEANFLKEKYEWMKNRILS